LTTKLHDLTSKADWAQNRADFHWNNAKNYEAQGRMNQALEEKTASEDEALRWKNYRLKIKEVENMIDNLTLRL
jgi:hypothetical protein